MLLKFYYLDGHLMIKSYISASNAYRNTVICFLLELLSYTLTPKHFPFMLHTIMSFGWGILGLLFLYQGVIKNTINIIRTPLTIKISIPFIFLFIVILFLGVYSYTLAIIKFDDYAEASDVIPQACILSQRFMEGEKVYQTIHVNGYDLEPTYLPFTWLPFCLTYISGIDPRILSLAVWLVPVAFTISYLFNKKYGHNRLVFGLILFSLIITLFSRYNPEDVTVTVELLHSAYYGLLVFGIIRNNYTWIGISLVFILLSRYSIIIWLPFAGLAYFLVESKRKTLIMFSLILVAIFSVYIFPFLILEHDFHAFIRGFKYYNQAAVGEWQPHKWQQPDDLPFHLFKGIGFAGWAFNFFSGTTEEKIEAYKIVHYVVSTVSVLILFYILFNRFRKEFSFELLILLSLKAYILVFYHFIIIPYSYLFLVPITISAVTLVLTEKKVYRVIN